LALELEELEALKPAFDSASACPELSDWVSVAPSVGYHPLCVKGSISILNATWRVDLKINAILCGSTSSKINGGVL